MLYFTKLWIERLLIQQTPKDAPFKKQILCGKNNSEMFIPDNFLQIWYNVYKGMADKRNLKKVGIKVYKPFSINKNLV